MQIAVRYLLPCLAILWLPANGQSSSLDRSSSSENPGIVKVRQSIAAMGGDLWSSIGASTVQLTILYPTGKSSSVTRSDDWSGETVRQRLDRGGKTTITTLTTSQRSLFLSNSRVLRTAPANYDLATLAETHPAVALRLGLSRKCQFKLLTSANTLIAAQIGAVVMVCRAPKYPEDAARFTWWFDSSGIPSQIEVPLLSMDGRFALYRTLKISQYKRTNNLPVPAEIQVMINGQLSATEAVGDVNFQASLPSATFAIPTAQ